MLERENKLADRRQAKGIWSPEITTAPPLLRVKWLSCQRPEVII